MAARKDKLAEAVCAREEKLRSDRQTLEGLWQQVALYTLPRKATFTEEVAPGVERNRWVLDSTAQRSLELFASFLHTLLNNPAVQWFQIGVVRDGERLDESSVAVQQWREVCSRIMRAEMASEAAGLYAQLHEVYLDEGAFGTSVLFLDDTGGQLRARNFHLDNVVIDENAFGFVDSVYRRWPTTVRRAKQRWPDRELGPQVDKAKDDTTVTFLHAVFPLSDEELARHLPKRILAARPPFASVWVNKLDKVTVDAGLYWELPYMAPRWYKVRGEIYGRSPAMTVLPDIRMANRMRETILRGAEKLVDPPLILPDGGLVSPVRLFPGALTFSDGEIKPQPLVPPGASRIEVGDALLQQTQQAIREGFFVPLFVTPDSPVKTATQVLQEVDERNRAVSPMLMRMQAELFHPMILRVFRLLERSGRLPPAPDELRDAEITVEYVSPLTASQRQIEALGVLRVLESLMPWAQIDPGVFDPFDPDEVARVVHAGSGAPASIMRTAREIKQVRDQRQQQMQQQMMQEQIIQAVEAGAKLQAANNRGSR